MPLTTGDLNDTTRFRHIKTIPYKELASFIIENISAKTTVMILFWSLCMIFLGIALIVIFNIGGYFSLGSVILHTLYGLIIFPVLIVPIHEILHIIPYFISGARNIRVGMEPDQFLFYVTAHRYVASSLQFRIVALIPFIFIGIILLFLVLFLPGLWKWSLSLLLFVHATMWAGDFALLNFYYLNRGKTIYTWDDADLKEAYYYEEI